jgi:hypothetical protein
MEKGGKPKIIINNLTYRQIKFALSEPKGTTTAEVTSHEANSTGELIPSADQAPLPIHLRMGKLMDSLGFTERALFEKCVVPLLSATTTKHFKAGGCVRQERDVVNTQARLKALEMAFKLRGLYKIPDPEVVERVHTIVVDIPRPALPVVEAPSDNAIDKKKPQQAGGQPRRGSRPLDSERDRQVPETLCSASDASPWGVEPRFVVRTC